MSINMGIHIYLRETYGEKFTAIQEIEDKIQTIQNQIEVLKKEHRGL